MDSFFHSLNVPAYFAVIFSGAFHLINALLLTLVTQKVGWIKSGNAITGGIVYAVSFILLLVIHFSVIILFQYESFDWFLALFALLCISLLILSLRRKK